MLPFPSIAKFVLFPSFTESMKLLLFFDNRPVKSGERKSIDGKLLEENKNAKNNRERIAGDFWLKWSDEIF